MTTEKLHENIHTLHRFIGLYCERKHHDKPKETGFLIEEYHLCEECKALLYYAHERLSACPHEPKPSCRKCPKPCYERNMWKKMAKVMMYSGMQLGLIKMRKFFAK